MRKSLTGLAALGVGSVLALACTGPSPVVGSEASAGKPASSTGGTMDASSGTGGSATGGDAGSGGTGKGGTGAAGRAAGASAGRGGSAMGGSGATTGATGGGDSGGSDSSGTSGGGGADEPGVSTTTAVMVTQLRSGMANFEDPETVKCMPRPLSAGEDGTATRLYRVSATACSCDAPSFGAVSDDVKSTARDYLRNVGACDFATLPACTDYCICEELPATGAVRDACLNQVTEPDAESGWCYISPDEGVGNPDLVSGCPDTQRRVLRLLGGQNAESDPLFLLMAAIPTVTAVSTSHAQLPVGAACLPDAERVADFNGFAMTEASLNGANSDCSSGLCLVNHLQGRVSCPYGQFQDQLDMPACFVPGSDDPVTVPVDSQRVARRAADTSICSCRCDGPGDGPFCACPDDMECAPVIPATGVPLLEATTGSYCIPKGTSYDPVSIVAADTCQSESVNGSNPLPCGDPRPY